MVLAFKKGATNGRSTVALKILDDCAEKTRAQITAYCRWECRHPFTQIDEEFDACGMKIYSTFLQFHDNLLTVERVPNRTDETPAQIPVHHGPYTVPPESPLSPQIIVIPNDIAGFCRVGERESGPPVDLVKSLEEHLNELKLISSAVSYFRIAWKRMIDIVPQCIENEFLAAFTLELREKLREELGVTEDSGHEKCKKYAVEEPSLKETKDSLVKMMATLDKAMKIVKRI